MPERDRFPAGVPCWIDTAQPRPQEAAGFYGGLFSWDFEDRTDVSGGLYLVARSSARDVAAIAESPQGGPATWRTYICVDDVEDTSQAVRRAGGSVLVEPRDGGTAGRFAMCADPGGATFSLWQPLARHGAQAVNEPNTWNWSDLNTSDSAGATAFYAAVFGWKAVTVNFGEFEGTMLCLPGYADFLEAYDPLLRQRHAEAGAPAGFSDAIGWMQPLLDAATGDHWSVTFAVDDAHKIAEHAVELGGSIVTPPFDADNVTIAALRDPAGAVFSVNVYRP